MPITVNAYGKSLDYDDLMNFYDQYFAFDQPEICMEELVELFIYWN